MEGPEENTRGEEEGMEEEGSEEEVTFSQRINRRLIRIQPVLQTTGSLPLIVQYHESQVLQVSSPVSIQIQTHHPLVS